jgi:hypothetical protein
MRHLRGDIEFAEELAIEHMDAHRGPRSQKSASEDLNTCLAALLQQIAKSHGVSRTEIIENFGHPSIAIAIGEQLPFVRFICFCQPYWSKGCSAVIRRKMVWPSGSS